MNQNIEIETDGERLRKKFEALKAETGMKKAEFARVFKVPGGASMISQHVSGHRPIGLDAAAAYMRGFNCSVDEISPTLAAQLPKLAFIPPNEEQKQPQVLIQPAPSTIKSIANGDVEDNSDLVAALRAFGLRLENADDTTKRRVKAVLNDLVDDPASHESLLPMLNAALTTPAPSKRRAA